MFHNKAVVITGGAQGIGKMYYEEFKKNNAFLSVSSTNSQMILSAIWLKEACTACNSNC